MAEMNTGRAVETGKTGIPVPAFRYSLHGTFPAVKTLIFCLGIIRIWNPSSNEKEAKSIMKPMNNKD
ncbi:hypothetical protein [Akkermansia sp. UNK.MGS-1]|uniref:hypothetical protein n=1 Tax=Akkermansia sp. UNK.MGS-1 TaxID=1638783 RepID=UPI002584E21A|nr:hypothetical protein [Akkermansia sp. UNK.MGS-1]